MAKTLNGVVVAANMTNAAVVEVTRKVPHPKYKKLLTRSKKFTAALNGHAVQVGDTVTISETRPLSKTIHFVVSTVTPKGSTSQKEEKK